MPNPQEILNEIRLRQAAAERSANRTGDHVSSIEANALDELGDWLEERIEEEGEEEEYYDDE
jgi:hypothetical protein